MKVTKRQLESMKFSSIDETRVVLQSIQIKGNETQATNGHILSIVTAPKEISNSDADPLLLNSEQAKQIAKLLKHGKNADIRQKSVCIENDTIKSDFHRFEMKADLVEGNFPNTNQVIPPENDRPIKFCVNPVYLRDICDYISKGQKDNYEKSVVISLVDREHSIVLESEDRDGHTLKFILMPVRM